MQSLSIISEAGLAHVHCFPFSPRAGTAAAKKKDLPSAVKKERMARIMRAAAQAEEKYISRFLGTERTALFEEDGGYTENYIRVHAEGAREGGVYRVRLTELNQGGVNAVLIKEL